jgi:hypothetical protein
LCNERRAGGRKMVFLVVVLFLCGLLIAGVIVYDNEKTKRKRKRKAAEVEKPDVFVSLMLSLIATFAGVFLAFNLSNYQIDRGERRNLGGLIGQSIDELNFEIVSLEGLPEFIKDRGVEDSIKMLNNNPLEDVVSVKFLISNQLLPKYCTQIGVVTILRLVRDKEKLREAVNNKDFAFENRLIYMDKYREYIEDLRDILVLERDFVGGKISAKKVAEGMKSLHYITTQEVPWEPNQRPWMPE